MHNPIPSLKPILAVILFLSMTAGCTTTTERPLGIQSDHIAFTTARMAALNCAPLPPGINLRDTAVTNVNAPVTNKICEEFDRFVVEGAKSQPYMKGFSAKVVGKLLAQAGASDLVQELPKIWANAQEEKGCKSYFSLATTYAECIAKTVPWQTWLAAFSQATRSSDSILIPLVLFANEQRRDDRGIWVAEQRIGVGALLVETSTGALVWYGQQTTTNVNKAIAKPNASNDLAYPDWSQTAERVFNEALWKEFPGRLVQ